MQRKCKGSHWFFIHLEVEWSPKWRLPVGPQKTWPLLMRKLAVHGILYSACRHYSVRVVQHTMFTSSGMAFYYVGGEKNPAAFKKHFNISKMSMALFYLIFFYFFTHRGWCWNIYYQIFVQNSVWTFGMPYHQVHFLLCAMVLVLRHTFLLSENVFILWLLHPGINVIYFQALRFPQKWSVAGNCVSKENHLLYTNFLTKKKWLKGCWRCSWNYSSRCGTLKPPEELQQIL